MFVTIWHDYLYQPLFNILIWIYSNWADHNLGWAVVYLTIMLRMVLLPFTLITERNKTKNEALEKEVLRLNKELHYDQILKKEEVRKLLRQKRVSPWSKIITLGIQVLVLILLYQVFLRGITGEKIMKILYAWIEFPGKINTVFYGFELGELYTMFWPGIVALFLLFEIYLDYRKKKLNLTKADLAYFLLFPAFTFFVLWFLPMVKSLFILTSIIFSDIIHWFSTMLFKNLRAPSDLKKKVVKPAVKRL